MAGQHIKAGVEHNPFFRFYETTIEYPVTDGSNGATLQINAIDWLHRVKARTIQTSYEILAAKAFEVSQHYIMLARELIMEQIRVEEFDGLPPSRQKCLFLSESIEDAEKWTLLVGGTGTICELSCTGTIHHADSRLMTVRSEPLSTTKEKVRAYWRGEVSSEPRMEVLFQGEALVSNTGL